MSNLNRYAPYYVQQIEVSQDANPLIPIVGQVYEDLRNPPGYTFRSKGVIAPVNIIYNESLRSGVSFSFSSGESGFSYKDTRYNFSSQGVLYSYDYVDENGERIWTDKITPEIRQQMLEQFEEFARPILGTKIKKPIINLQWLYNMLNEDRFK
ncbi:MAG: hypothetical protein Q4B80_01420 [Aerococcaceae bacterium]|nr:hypothetical protein [Aerococcaceae bacterium]